MENAMRRAIDKAKNKDEETDLPGFRFHPTDEELVGFYLRRKVEGRPLKIELITQLDIYKYDPWDLPVPKISYVEGKEYYFFCIRARKYRNSVRPNRVTAAGFWKATGIDKNIYSSSTRATTTNECIGLKKCLVYYRGKAGKGIKTDWMMHEFRLPPSWKSSDPKYIISHQEEEVDWTLCRIFKRDTSERIYKPQLKRTSNSMKDSLGSENSDGYIHSQDMALPLQIQVPDSAIHLKHKNHFYASQQTSSVAQSSYSSSNSNIWSQHRDEFVRDTRKWDELSYVVDSASDPTILFGYYG